MPNCCNAFYSIYFIKCGALDKSNSHNLLEILHLGNVKVVFLNRFGQCC